MWMIISKSITRHQSMCCNPLRVQRITKSHTYGSNVNTAFIKHARYKHTCNHDEYHDTHQTSENLTSSWQSASASTHTDKDEPNCNIHKHLRNVEHYKPASHVEGRFLGCWAEPAAADAGDAMPSTRWTWWNAIQRSAFCTSTHKQNFRQNCYRLEILTYNCDNGFSGLQNI